MKYGTYQRDEGTTRRCHKASTHFVSWTMTESHPQFSFQKFLCEPDARALVARMEARGKPVEIKALD